MSRFEIDDQRAKLSPEDLQDLGTIIGRAANMVHEDYSDTIKDEETLWATEDYPTWKKMIETVPLSALLQDVARRVEHDARAQGAQRRILN